MSDARPYAVWPDPRSRSRSRVIESHSRGVAGQSRMGLNFVMFSTKPRDWLGITFAKWPVLCWVGHKTLTQSVNQATIFVTTLCYFIISSCLNNLLIKLTSSSWCAQQQPYGILHWLWWRRQLNIKTGHLLFHPLAVVCCHADLFWWIPVLYSVVSTRGSHKPGKPGIVREFCTPGKVREFEMWSGIFLWHVTWFTTYLAMSWSLRVMCKLN